MLGMERICLTRRCGLCCFRFDPGDDVVAVRAGRHSSSVFQYKEGGTFLDGQLAYIVYVACTVSCSHPRGLVVGCHALCLRLLAPAPLERCLLVNRYQFEPPASHEPARRRWLKKTLASRLELPRPLPPELRQGVASYLLREYAASATVSLSLGPNPNRPAVSLSSPFVEHLVDFQGQTYVGSLVEAPPEQSDSKTPPCVIHVSHNHHGILQVIATDSETVPATSYVRGVWWKSLRIPNPACRLELHGDAVKLRDLTCYDGSRERSSTRGRPSWAIIPSRGQQFWSYDFCKMTSQLPPQIDVFRYNVPGTTGYSICCNPEPIAFHTHKSGDDDLAFYQETSEYSVWIHVPFCADESISGIWMRRRQKLDLELALAFETNKQRTILLGAWVTPSNEWALLATPDGAPGRFFFDRCPYSIRALLFQSPPPPQTRLPQFPDPSSNYPRTRNLEGYFWSWARAEGIKEIVPCCRQTDGQPQVLGLLISYLDGPKACLGQVRLDQLGEPMAPPPDPSQKLYLGFEYTKAKCPYVAEIRFSAAPPDSARVLWFEVDWSGTIEWWFSYRQCQVWQNGRTSLATKVV